MKKAALAAFFMSLKFRNYDYKSDNAAYLKLVRLEL
jgi:hypothetical protein